MAAFMRFILRRRFWVLAGLGLLTALGGLSASRGKVGTSIGGMFLGEHPDFARYLERARDYGNDDAIFISVSDPDFLSPAGQARIEQAISAIKRLPTVDRVRSVLDVQHIRSSEDSIDIRTYADLAKKPGADLARLTLKLGNDPFARGVYISKDGRHAIVVVELDTDPNRPAEDLPALVQGIRSAFKQAAYQEEQIHLAGISATVTSVIEQTQYNLKRLFPLVGVMLLVTVWIMFRRLWPVAVTGLVALITVTLTMGFAMLLDRNVSIFTAMVPPVILIIAFCDVVHLCSAYLLELDKGKTKEEAILACGSEVGAACVFTSVTTFVGFVSIATVPVPASRIMGLSLGFGAGIALLVAVTLTPILFSLMPRPKTWRTGTTGKVQKLLDRFLDFTCRVTTRHPKVVVAIFVSALAIIVVGLLGITIEADFARRLSEDHWLRQDGRFFRQQYAGTNVMNLYLRTPRKQGLLDPDVFHKVVAYQRALAELPEVDRVISLKDMMEQLHEAMVSSSESQRELPRSRQALAQYLLLFEMSGGEDLDRLVDFDRQEMLLRVSLKSEEFRHTGVVGRKAEALGRQVLGGTGATVKAGGIVFMMGDFFNTILDGQKRALVLVVVLITLMMMVGLRSVRVGLLSMGPNILPLLALGGWVGLTWDYIDSDGLLVAMIAIGIGVDDTIHFLMRLRIESRRRKDITDALEHTFNYSGRGILITTVILVVGFSPLALSDYLSIRMLGTLLPLTLAVALVADLFLVPALAQLGVLRYKRGP